MSLLLHIIGKVIFFTVFGVVVLTLLTWFTKNTKSDQTARSSLHEWPEDKGTHVDRISARRPASSARDSKREQERWRA
jgi:hypothetical protein